jgi:hypothetical protein
LGKSGLLRKIRKKRLIASLEREWQGFVDSGGRRENSSSHV